MVLLRRAGGDLPLARHFILAAPFCSGGPWKGMRMKEFIKGRSFKILLASVLILMGLLLFTAASGNNWLASLFGFVTTPMQQLSSGAVEGATQPTYEELQAQNEEYRQQLETMINRTIDYYDIKKTSEQYRQYLGIKEQNPDLEFVAGSVIQRDPSDPFYGFTLDQGSQAGVEVNDPVITNLGVIGWVSEVGSTYCKVRTVLSPDTNIGVVDTRTNDGGVVTGDAALAQEGKMKMVMLAAKNDIQKDDIVVTTGVGGMYPKGLALGVVEEVRQDEGSTSQYAVIKPYDDIAELRDVLIVVGFTGQYDILDPRQSGEDLTQDDASSQESSSSEAAPDASASAAESQPSSAAQE